MNSPKIIERLCPGCGDVLVEELEDAPLPTGPFKPNLIACTCTRILRWDEKQEKYRQLLYWDHLQSQFHEVTQADVSVLDLSREDLMQLTIR